MRARGAEEVELTFADAIRSYVIAPLDDEDIAAIARIWNKLNDARERENRRIGAGAMPRAGRRAVRPRAAVLTLCP
jgi:hypothetical protein